MKLSKQLKSWLSENMGIAPTVNDDEAWDTALVAALTEGKLSKAKLNELTADDDVKSFVKGAVKEALAESGTKSPTSATVFGNVRVKPESEKYSATKSPATHRKTGQAVFDERGRQAETSSEVERAKMGTILKFLAGKAGIPAPLSEHERHLLEETFERDLWCGKVGSEFVTDLPGARAKILLDDVTSGGSEVVPHWFDTNVITYPLLTGELFPWVDRVEVPRASAVDGAALSSPTTTWGVGEGSSLTPFVTDDILADISASIFPASVAVECGRDFLTDSAVSIGTLLEQVIGERFSAELDKVIANGNGSSQPEGIFQASGLGSVTTDNAAAGPPTVSDYEDLVFGVAKQYRRPNFNCAFIANDTTYSRARGIAVSGTDQRRVFGMTHQDYQLLEHPFRVQNDLANTVAAFGALKRYRLWRRQAMGIEFFREGKSLALANTALLVCRTRVGGKVVDANAFAKWTNGQS